MTSVSGIRRELRTAFADLRSNREAMLEKNLVWLDAYEALECAEAAALEALSSDYKYDLTAIRLATWSGATAERLAAQVAHRELVRAEADRDLALGAVAREIVNALLQALG